MHKVWPVLHWKMLEFPRKWTVRYFMYGCLGARGPTACFPTVAHVTTVFCTEWLNVKVYTVDMETSLQEWAGLTPEVCCICIIYAIVKIHFVYTIILFVLCLCLNLHLRKSVYGWTF